jgi:hypothetical protein
MNPDTDPSIARICESAVPNWMVMFDFIDPFAPAAMV